jgi:hypothetical protein
MAAKKKTKAKPKPKPKKSAAKKKPAAKKKTATKKKAAPAKRRDATGHLSKKYAADLRARSRASRSDDGDAFIRKNRARDSLAEQLGEEAVQTMTSAEDQSDQLQDVEVEEERGGPFVTTSGRKQFAKGTDKSNPRGAKREPFPRT